MKIKAQIVFLFTLVHIMLFCACEKVVVLNLDTAAPQLVVEANITWVKGTSGHLQKIKLSKTIPYYAQNTIPVNDAENITIKNSAGRIFNFARSEVAGEYICQDFVPKIGEQYELNLTYQGKKYTASEQLSACPEISKVTQDENGGFAKNEMEVVVFFRDIPNQENQYLIAFATPYKQVQTLFVLEDKFYNGVQLSSSITEKQLKQGDQVNIRLEGISKPYFNYMRLTLQNVAGANPFQAIAANARGNIYSQDSANEYALGYFRLSEADVMDDVIK